MPGERPERSVLNHAEQGVVARLDSDLADADVASNPNGDLGDEAVTGQLCGIEDALRRHRQAGVAFQSHQRQPVPPIGVVVGAEQDPTAVEGADGIDGPLRDEQVDRSAGACSHGVRTALRRCRVEPNGVILP